jgi:signal transduction histidine kinase
LILYFSLLFVLGVVMLELMGLMGMPFTPYSGMRGQQREEAFRFLDLIADTKKERLLRWLEERRDDTHVTASNELVKTSVSRLRTAIRKLSDEGIRGADLWTLVHDEKCYEALVRYLDTVIAAYAVYNRVHIIDAASKRIIASTDVTQVGEDVSDRYYLAACLRADGVHVGDIEMDQPRTTPALRICDIIRDEKGRAMAVLMMHVNAEDIIRPILHTGEGLGTRGETLLINHDVKILTSLKHPLADGSLAKPLEYQIRAKAAVLAASGNEGIIETEDYRGEPVLAAYRHVRVNPELGWGMVVKVDKAELFAPLRQQMKYASAVGLAVILGVIGLTVFMGRSLIDPLLSLDKTAGEVAEGNLEAQASVTTSDEIGHLATTFNDMIRRIRKRTAELASANEQLTHEIVERKHAEEELTAYREHLKELVEERTAELAAANEQLTQEINERNRAEEALRDALAESRKRGGEASALLASSRAVLEFPEFEAAERAIFDACKKLIGATAGYIALLSDDGTENEVLFLDAGGRPCTVDPSLPMPVRGLRAEAYKSKKPAYENRFNDSTWTEFLPAGHVAMDNVLFAPLLLRGDAVGVIGLANKPEDFTEEDARLAMAFADHAAIALQNSRNLDALRKSEARYRGLSERLEEAVKKKVAELQQAQSLAALGQMVSVVAHEVRNPLQNIQMGVDTIRREVEGDSHKLQILDEINYGVNLLNGIIRDLLEYSRPVMLHYSSWPIQEIVGRALRALAHKLHDISVHVELEQEDKEISVDIAKFTAVLVNLLSNAAEAMPNGGDIWIRSTCSESDGSSFWNLSISDNGCGIDEKHLERIHEPFFTTKTRGTGLGIPVCDKVIGAHNGNLQIVSTFNQGTTARIRLPVREPQYQSERG